MTSYRANPLRRRLMRGEVGVIANGPNTSEMCDFLGQFGFDAAFVDFEHGGFDWRELADISRACDLWDMGAAVRVSKLDEALILRALDLGATSIIVPHVMTPEEADRAARACRYPSERVPRRRGQSARLWHRRLLPPRERGGPVHCLDRGRGGSGELGCAA